VRATQPEEARRAKTGEFRKRGRELNGENCGKAAHCEITGQTGKIQILKCKKEIFPAFLGAVDTLGRIREAENSLK